MPSKALLLVGMVSSSPIGDPDLVPRAYPQNGGGPGNYWHKDFFTLTWKTHTRQILTNVTEHMPGWNPSWASHFAVDSPPTNQVSFGTGIFGHVQNNCPTTVYIHTSIGANNGGPGGDDPADPVATYPIAPGTTYSTSIPAVINGAGGVSIKIGPDSTMNPGNIYQIEYTQFANSDGNMATWYVLSSVNGDPFVGSARYMQVTSNSGACSNIYNAPGSAVGDWPNVQGECEAAGDLYFYLC
ncbi:hypothetical protein LTR78_006477 [Recurvomyces mirabilis]|uniref:Uncharacterized protein n=1 Tax=Recurvomyces mirabilis TaxID=574656 RepID=A0AAE0WKV6_9PEZI|nr:hypothetical protein LTR78_006477 [Recurvomyces mirabilis]KAK5151104.1 hypothetical protein LTS14_009600 [Recurvomyces mirabilis]